MSEDSEDSAASSSPDSPGEPDIQVTGSTAFVILIALCHAGLLIFYFGYVWSYSKFQYEFTGWSSLPIPLPQSFIDQRFNFQWFWISWMIFNLFPVYTALWIVLNPTQKFRHDVHRIVILVAAIACFLNLVYFFFVVWIFENNTQFDPFSLPNSVDYCCKRFGEVTLTYACHNIHECEDLPTSPTIRLATDPIFYNNLLGMALCLVFLLLEIFVTLMFNSYVRTDTEIHANADLPSYYGQPPASAKPTAAFGSGVVHIVNAVYIVFVCVFFTCGLLVLDIRYTHQFPAVGPYDIRSARGTLPAVGLIMSSSVLLMPAFVLLVMAARRIRWALWLMFVLIGLLTLVHFFCFMTMVYSRGQANRPGQPNSLANHPLRCCAGDVYDNAASECDNVDPCTLPLSQFPRIVNPLTSSSLPCNSTHTLIFVFMILMLILDAVIIVLVLVVYIGHAGTVHTVNAVHARIGRWMASSSSSASSTQGRYPPPAAAAAKHLVRSPTITNTHTHANNNTAITAPTRFSHMGASANNDKKTE